MLALAPEGKRARTWLQDKLWSTRGPEQGAASLRQSIYELRAALNDDRDVVVADKFNLALDLSRCVVDLDDYAARGSRPDAELLEGLDVGDDEFEDWLREQRARFTERAPQNNEPGPRAEPPGTLRPAIDTRAILLLSAEPSDKSEASIVADSLLDSIAKTVVELGVAKVYDRRTVSGQQGAFDNLKGHDALSLRTEFFDSETRKMVRLALLQMPESSLAWSSTLELPSTTLDHDDPRVKACVNLVVNVAVDQFGKLNAGRPDKMVAQILCQSGIVHLFRLGKTNLELADSFFARAFDIEPRGIYLAWRAYVRTFLFAERHYTSFSSREGIEAEAFDFARRALEMEPYNSYVAALSAHVYSVTRRSDAAAYELAERSIQLNHANPLGWACLGVAETYLGKVAEGLRHTLIAREIAGYAPYRYQLDAFSFIASAMAGDLDRAILLAEACHALAPTFAPPIRYLSALYAHKGDEEQALRMVEKLRVNEPDFSLDRLRDQQYPVAGLRRTTIISSLPKKQI
jgi:tetratricopeptide (TPR) repeat protein